MITEQVVPSRPTPISVVTHSTINRRLASQGQKTRLQNKQWVEQNTRLQQQYVSSGWMPQPLPEASLPSPLLPEQKKKFTHFRHNSTASTLATAVKVASTPGDSKQGAKFFQQRAASRSRHASPLKIKKELINFMEPRSAVDTNLPTTSSDGAGRSSHVAIQGGGKARITKSRNIICKKYSSVVHPSPPRKKLTQNVGLHRAWQGGPTSKLMSPLQQVLVPEKQSSLQQPAHPRPNTQGCGQARKQFKIPSLLPDSRVVTPISSNLPKPADHSSSPPKSSKLSKPLPRFKLPLKEVIQPDCTETVSHYMEVRPSVRCSDRLAKTGDTIKGRIQSLQKRLIDLSPVGLPPGTKLRVRTQTQIHVGDYQIQPETGLEPSISSQKSWIPPSAGLPPSMANVESVLAPLLWKQNKSVEPSARRHAQTTLESTRSMGLEPQIADTWLAPLKEQERREDRNTMVVLDRQVAKLEQIQARAKKVKLIRQYRKDFGINLKETNALCMPLARLEVVLARKAQQVVMGQAASKIQKWFRSWKDRKVMMNRLHKLIQSIIRLQRAIRKWEKFHIARKKLSSKKESSVVRIQSCLRGYTSRQKHYRAVALSKADALHEHYSRIETIMKSHFQRMVRRAWLKYKERKKEQQRLASQKKKKKPKLNIQRKQTVFHGGMTFGSKKDESPLPLQPKKMMSGLGGVVGTLATPTIIPEARDEART